MTRYISPPIWISCTIPSPLPSPPLSPPPALYHGFRGSRYGVVNFSPSVFPLSFLILQGSRKPNLIYPFPHPSLAPSLTSFIKFHLPYLPHILTSPIHFHPPYLPLILISPLLFHPQYLPPPLHFPLLLSLFRVLWTKIRWTHLLPSAVVPSGLRGQKIGVYLCFATHFPSGWTCKSLAPVLK